MSTIMHSRKVAFKDHLERLQLVQRLGESDNGVINMLGVGIFKFQFLSIKSGSTNKEDLDTLLKNISKESTPSINDANNATIR